jgi:uncharacterized protein YukE
MRIRPLLTILLSLTGVAIALPSRAQNQQPAPLPAAASETSGEPSQTPSKKVWTNDDFDSHAAAATAAKPAPKPKPAKSKPASGKNASWYRTQISKLNGQIADIDQQIASYQAALNGEPPPNQGVQEYHMRRADWQAEIQKLNKQKQDLLDRISALEDEARHNGIEDGQLR